MNEELENITNDLLVEWGNYRQTYTEFDSIPSTTDVMILHSEVDMLMTRLKALEKIVDTAITSLQLKGIDEKKLIERILLDL